MAEAGAPVTCLLSSFWGGEGKRGGWDLKESQVSSHRNKSRPSGKRGEETQSLAGVHEPALPEVRKGRMDTGTHLHVLLEDGSDFAAYSNHVENFDK